MAVRISPHFGIVIRRAALAQRGVTREQLLRAVETAAPLDQDGDLLSFGPHFGSEAAANIHRSLERLGLVYVDDFFEFSGDFPEWCAFAASANRP